MGNKTLVAIFIVAIIAIGVVQFQPQLVKEAVSKTNNVLATFRHTVTRIATTTATMVSTATVLETITETVTATVRTVTTTTTTTVTPQRVETIIQGDRIDLVSPYEDNAASWDKTNLSIVVETNRALGITSNSQEVATAGRAIAEWRRALSWFAQAYPDYIYLSNLKLNVYVADVNDTSIQGNAVITIGFVRMLTITPSIGVTNITFTDTPAITRAEIRIGVERLTMIGLQNIIVHELGHALGLGHSDKDGDLMFPTFERSEVRRIVCPSTLDLYGLALAYSWVKTGNYQPYGALATGLPEGLRYQNSACN